MTKGELRKARRQAHAEGKPLTGELALDRDQNSNVELGAERNPDGSYNTRRADYLERCAQMSYDYDRDF